MPNRVLIVDDDRTVTMVLAESLEKLGAGYTIETAFSAYEALDKARKEAFDLIVTDLRMPGMDGLEFMKLIREYHPHTRLILMTGYGSAEIEATAYRLGACRYINKPFKTEKLLAEVRKSLARPEAPGRDILVLSDEQFDALAQCLSDLQFEVGAQCILLADIAGQLIAHIGETERLDLPMLISLVGGSFATAFEMARHLGESQALTLNYHEGEYYDVYSSNVNEELFVVLLFDKRRQRSRIGMVWLYTRRALGRLQTLVNSAGQVSASGVLDADFGALLNDSMDQLLAKADDESLAPGRPVGRPDGGGSNDKVFPPGEAAVTLQKPSSLTSAPAFPPPPAEHIPSAELATFTLEQALEMGLLDPSWADQTDDSC